MDRGVHGGVRHRALRDRNELEPISIIRRPDPGACVSCGRDLEPGGTKISREDRDLEILRDHELALETTALFCEGGVELLHFARGDIERALAQIPVFVVLDVRATDSSRELGPARIARDVVCGETATTHQPEEKRMELRHASASSVNVIV